jgi:hypothetical protein
MKCSTLGGAVAFLLAVSSVARAQPETTDKPAAASGADTASELAKKVQNPVSDLISVPLQNNTDFGVGPDKSTKNTLNVQPVVPFKLGSEVLMISRTIVPIVSQPAVAQDDRTFGLGDISASLFFAPAKQGALIYGVGPAFLLPTATPSRLGTEKWSVGPTAVLLAQPKPWTYGVLASNVWSFAGKDARESVNLLTLQYFVNYNLPRGWYLTSAPILSSNWKAEPTQRWTVPFGGGVGKVFHAGMLPFNGSASAYYNAVRPDLGPTWQLRLQLAILLPT